MYRTITMEQVQDFRKYLIREERSINTVEKYIHDVKAFCGWLNGRAVNKESVTEWKTVLCKKNFGASTVNSYLAALHSFFYFMEWMDCKVRYLKVQRRVFRDASRELTKNEFERLVITAENSGKSRLALLIETICATGIRVSEVRYITVEAAKRGVAEISLKGKIRTILIPGKLTRKLIKYARQQKIASGEIFITKSGKGMTKRQIWGEMKALSKVAGVDASKVFPHNLRHLFARTFYKACHDIVCLADVLGHSSVETTRIYLISTGAEHARQLDRLGLIS